MTSSGVAKIMDPIPSGKEAGSQKTSEMGGVFHALLNSKTVPNAGQGSGEFFPKNDIPVMQKDSYDKVLTGAGYKDFAKVDGQTKQSALTKHLKEELQSLEKEVTKEIADMLGVTEEDVIEAMKLLGISMENLLMGKGLAELVKQLTGAVDTMALLFDSNFQNLMQKVESLLQEFASEHGLSRQEMEKLLTALAKDAEEAAVEGKESAGKAEVVTDPEKQTQTQKPEGEAEEPQRVITERFPGAEESSGQEDQRQGTMDAQANPQKGMDAQEAKAGNQAAFDKEEFQPQQMSYQTVENTVRSVGEQIVNTVERAFVNPEDILSQVMEFTRVTVAQAESSIEMQLNPAHLGKIYLQVVSKEGVITAQLAAQNEAVKQALESQAAVLRENMSQQGLKVEAVEVTVASHEFEQNLEGQRQQAEQEQAQAQEQRSKSRRFLTIDQLDAMADTLTEEENLAARIMLENGNSMDMTV